ncbi:MAG: hypothetical protein WD555_03500, partial [Fulvivirga sp.]
MLNDYLFYFSLKGMLYSARIHFSLKGGIQSGVPYFVLAIGITKQKQNMVQLGMPPVVYEQKWRVDQRCP